MAVRKALGYINGATAEIPPTDQIATDAGAMTIRPVGATVTSDLAAVLGRNLTFADFGAKPMTASELAAATKPATATTPSYIDGSLFPSTVLSHTTIFNTYAKYCYYNNKPMIIPPGDYVVKNKLDMIGVPIYAAGARIYMPNNNASNAPGLIIRTEPDAMENIDVSEVQSWTGWERYSRKLGNLKNRKGQFITPEVDESIQYLSLRGPDIDDAYGFLDPFLVATDDGELFHALYANADVRQPNSRADWINSAEDVSLGEVRKNTYYAKTLRAPIEINGLTLIMYDDGSTEPCKAGVSIRRCRTRMQDCSIFNKSNRQMLVGYNINKSCFVDFENCLVDGLIGGPTGGTTHYGFQVGGSASVTFTKCRTYHCRRGVDVQRGKNVHMQDCELHNGWGAHWGWWIGSDGGIVSATGIRGGEKQFAENPHAVLVAGGGFYCTNADVYVSQLATAAFRVRTDNYQCADDVIFSNNRVVFDGDVSEYRLLDFRLFDEARDYGRPIEMPRNLVAENNHIIVRRPNKTLTLLFWLRPRATTWLPKGISVDTRFSIRKNSIYFEEGGATTVNGQPRIRAYINKPSTKQVVGGAGATGSGINGIIADLPYLYLETDVDPEAADSLVRLTAQVERIAGLFMVRRASGSFREILAEAGSIDDAVLTAPFDGTSRVGNTKQADEYVGPYTKRGLFTSARNSGFNYAGTTQLAVDSPTNAVNFPVLAGSISGNGIIFTAAGTDTNIPLRLYGKGSGTVSVGQTGNALSFYGTTGTTKQTLPAAATTPEATQTLANELRAKLIALGLFN
ncbi:hypothetical protein [Methylorubrum sp. SB2]|uniref:hypothetical protein n=1 Tax=Methylorubrum subtropicum TaxID=3138812 RepID=UPI00313EDE64